jgi:hypothetical protein
MKTSTLTVNIAIRKWCIPLLVILVLLRLPVPRWVYTLEAAPCQQ